MLINEDKVSKSDTLPSCRVAGGHLDRLRVYCQCRDSVEPNCRIVCIGFRDLLWVLRNQCFIFGALYPCKSGLIMNKHIVVNIAFNAGLACSRSSQDSYSRPPASLSVSAEEIEERKGHLPLVAQPDGGASIHTPRRSVMEANGWPSTCSARFRIWNFQDSSGSSKVYPRLSSEPCCSRKSGPTHEACRCY